MAYVQVPKDFSKVKTKIAFNLTKRQLIGFSLAGSIGFPAYYYTRELLGNELSMSLLIALSFPILFITFYEKDGVPAELYFKAIYLHQFYQPKVRIKKAKWIKYRKEKASSEKQRPGKKTAQETSGIKNSKK